MYYPRSMKIRKRYLFLAIPVVVSMIFLLFVETRFLSRESREADILRQQVRDAWKNANFTKIGHTETFETSIREIVRQHKAAGSLSETQRQALTKALLRFLYAHHDGSWESFRAFRIPVGPKHVRFNKQLFSSSVPLSILADTLSAERDFDSSMELFDAVGEEYFVNPEAVVSEGEFKGMPAFCAKCWNAVALDSIQLSLYRIRDNREHLPSVFAQLASTGEASVEMIFPSLTFSPSPGALIRSEKSVNFVFFTMLVRTDRANYPVGLSSYWSPLHREWLPYELAIGSYTVEYLF